jgi:hypothetical protein
LDRILGRLTLLHTVVQFGCNWGANILLLPGRGLTMPRCMTRGPVCTVAYTPLPAIQAVPYGVTDTGGLVFSCKDPPCSLMVFLPPLYNQLSHEQGRLLDSDFSTTISHRQAEQKHHIT